ncbi:hypothetical protein ACQRBN_12125 [Bariatricus sp. SGI.154]|uniref:hypothetical protein n=1 Tax=Bariatricus sp. SGI.154 TaxID=3420549 RepID=UPI003D02197D
MDSIVGRLADIETTAEAIVEHAQAQKSEIEKKVQAKRDRFDQELEEETQKKLQEIRQEADAKMERILAGQRDKNRSTIDGLKKEFEKNHNDYAREILAHIIEV